MHKKKTRLYDSMVRLALSLVKQCKLRKIENKYICFSFYSNKNIGNIIVNGLLYLRLVQLNEIEFYTISLELH